MISRLKLPIVAAAFALSMGCATPKYLTNDFTMGDRSVKYLLTPAATVDVGGGKKEQLYDFIVRICDLDPQDREAQCKDTTVVENVYPQSI